MYWISTILGTITTVARGHDSGNLKTYISLSNDPWDNNTQLNFMEPMGSFGIEYDLNPNIRLLEVFIITQTVMTQELIMLVSNL